MKHLKRYNESSNEFHLKLDIKEILRDCEDLGLQTRISIDYSEDDIPSVDISIVNKPTYNNHVARIEDTSVNSIYFKDIKHCIDHLINYMKGEGYGEFIYHDTVSKFNKKWRIGDLDGGFKPNILPPLDNSGSSAIGFVHFSFYKM